MESVLILHVTILVLIQMWCARCNVRINYEKIVEHGMFLEGAVFRTIDIIGTCAFECRHRAACKSFNWNKNRLSCELNSKTADSTPSMLLLSPGYLYGTKAAWSKVGDIYSFATYLLVIYTFSTVPFNCHNIKLFCLKLVYILSGYPVIRIMFDQFSDSSDQVRKLAENHN
jgi:hypothetical protein